MKKHVLALLPPALCIAAAVTIAAASCGLEEYYYLPPVPQENITVTLADKAVIRLPNVDDSTSGFYYFETFTIFYRIYISSTNIESIPTSEYSKINYALASDYSAIHPSTDITVTSTNTAIGSLFKTRGFYELRFAGADIRNELYYAKGDEITLDFSATGGNPKMSVNTFEYPLYRSNGDNVFEPKPDRYFRNTADIYASANAIATVNADVANNTGIPATGRHTYAAFYIALEGLDERTFAAMYSKPTFIGVMKLP